MLGRLTTQLWNEFCLTDKQVCNELKRISSRMNLGKYLNKIKNELLKYQNALKQLCNEIVSHRQDLGCNDIGWFYKCFTHSADSLKDLVLKYWFSPSEDFIAHFSPYFVKMKQIIEGSRMELQYQLNQDKRRSVEYSPPPFGRLDLDGLCLCYAKPTFLNRR